VSDAKKSRKLERIKRRMENVVDDCESLLKICNGDLRMKELRDKALEFYKLI